MRFACEAVAHEILPALRAVISKELMDQYDMSQMQVATILEVSQPAVSQYMRDLRGERKKFFADADIDHMVKNLCADINGKRIEQEKIAKEFQRICSLVVEKHFSQALVACEHLEGVRNPDGNRSEETTNKREEQRP